VKRPWKPKIIAVTGPAVFDDWIDIIRAPEHKTGSRSTQPTEGQVKAPVVFAQEAILRIFPHGLPAERPRNLRAQVQEMLDKHTPEWPIGRTISRAVVNKAWQELKRL
jgi:hypothetical protein